MRRVKVTPEAVNRALSDLELNPTVRRLIGAAVKGGQSILLHGKPGNGKSSVAKRIVNMIGGSVLIPYAIDVGGQTIRVYDPRVHTLAEVGSAVAGGGPGSSSTVRPGAP
jgi:predicted ATPase with chaperone activity